MSADLSLADASAPYGAFKRKFLLLLMVSGILFTGLFEIAALARLIPLTDLHFKANLAHIGTAAVLIACLLRKPHWYQAIAWAEALNSFMIFLSALYAMPADEMRYVWFFVQAGGSFLLLGSAAGWATIAVTIAIVVASVATGLIGLSVNGIATFCIGLPCSGVLFHAYNAEVAQYIDKLRRANQRVEHAARHDALTGLLNRAAFGEAGEALAAVAGRESPLSLLFVDVDRFKSINDRFGHAGGDLALVAVARAIERAVRPTDIVARLGGEEIVVLLPGTDETGALSVAERLRAEVEGAQPRLADGPLVITVSVGWATAAAAGCSIEALARTADEAMYRAKQAGRNRVEPRSVAEAVCRVTPDRPTVAAVAPPTGAMDPQWVAA